MRCDGDGGGCGGGSDASNDYGSGSGSSGSGSGVRGGSGGGGGDGGGGGGGGGDGGDGRVGHTQPATLSAERRGVREAAGVGGLRYAARAWASLNASAAGSGRDTPLPPAITRVQSWYHIVRGRARSVHYDSLLCARRGRHGWSGDC